MVVFSFVTNILILIKVWPNIKFNKIWLLILSSIVAAPLGTYVLMVINQGTLKIMVGIIIIIFALLLWKGYSLTVKNEKLAFIPVGFTSGLLNGSVSLMGPPVVLFLTNQGEDKATFRANLTAYAFVLNIVTIVSFFMGDLINDEVITYLLWFSPALFVGTFLGMKIAGSVEQQLFKKITLGLIIVSGISAIISSIT